MRQANSHGKKFLAEDNENLERRALVLRNFASRRRETLRAEEAIPERPRIIDDIGRADDAFCQEKPCSTREMQFRTGKGSRPEAYPGLKVFIATLECDQDRSTAHRAFRTTCKVLVTTLEFSHEK